jgi:hypothetical protein
MNDAEVAFKQVQSLLDFLKTFAEAKSSLLKEVEIALQGNSGNPEALQALTDNLRGLRQNILAELRNQLK